MTAPGPDVSVADAHATLAAEGDGVVLLDVREDEEWAAGHAPGAVHVPLADLDPGRLDTGTPVLAICRSGGRSARAAAYLAQAGFDVRNVAGGMAAWEAADLPVVRDDGSPGEIV